MARVNVLILLHGMTIEAEPTTHTAQYVALWRGLIRKQPVLEARIDARLFVEWGHEPPSVPPGQLAPDQRITDAENFIVSRVSAVAVAGDRSPDNHRLDGGLGDLFSRLALRRLTTPIKERIMLLGFADAIYYCSPDGEEAIRRQVYGQFLEGLAPYREASEVRLHLIAESLGVTVGFDFLFGLFAPDSEFPGGIPGFVRDDQGTDEDKEAYQFWRRRAQQGTLLLGSNTSVGAQLALMQMRKQKLVDHLAAGQRLDPTVIGVPRQGPPRWKVFFDLDDVLGFPARRLFDAQGSIQEYQVNTGWRPDQAHGGYWTNDNVLTEVARMIQLNL